MTTDHAERLARLQSRRTSSEQDSAPTVATDPNPPGPVPPSDGKARRQRRRRSPARDAKILTVGASTTALLGMIAAYGIADGLVSADTSTAGTIAPDVPLPASASTTPPATVPPATLPPTTAPTTVPPQVIVVVIDSATGLPISTSVGTGDDFLQTTLDGLTTGATQPVPDGTAPAATAPAASQPSSSPATPTATPAPAPAPAPTPAPAPATTLAPAAAPAPAPAPVDLAVPPAPAPAPVTTVPQGSSSGS